MIKRKFILYFLLLTLFGFYSCHFEDQKKEVQVSSNEKNKLESNNDSLLGKSDTVNIILSIINSTEMQHFLPDYIPQKEPIKVLQKHHVFFRNFQNKKLELIEKSEIISHEDIRNSDSLNIRDLTFYVKFNKFFVAKNRADVVLELPFGGVVGEFELKKDNKTWKIVKRRVVEH